MKRNIIILAITCLLLTFPFFLSAQTPPHPNGGNPPGGGNNPVGGGAPIGNGTVILFLLAASFAGIKEYRRRTESAEEEV